MSRWVQIGVLGVLLVAFLVVIALLPAKTPSAANTPAAATPTAATATPAGISGNQIATAVGNAPLATALVGVDRNRLATAFAGINRDQAATIVANSGALRTGECLNIKGVIMPDGTKTYYLPGSYYYDASPMDPVKGDRFFCSAADALAAGFTPGK